MKAPGILPSLQQPRDSHPPPASEDPEFSSLGRPTPGASGLRTPGVTESSEAPSGTASPPTDQWGLQEAPSPLCPRDAGSRVYTSPPPRAGGAWSSPGGPRPAPKKRPTDLNTGGWLEKEVRDWPGGTVRGGPPASAGASGSVRGLEDSTCCGASPSTRHWRPDPALSHSYRACALQLLKPGSREPALPDKRSRRAPARSEPVRHNQRKLLCSNKDPLKP